MNVQLKIFGPLIDLRSTYLSPGVPLLSSTAAKSVTKCYLMALENVSECLVPLFVPERALLSRVRLDNLEYFWAKVRTLLMMLPKATFPFLEYRVSSVQALEEAQSAQ